MLSQKDLIAIFLIFFVGSNYFNQESGVSASTHLTIQQNESHAPHFISIISMKLLLS